MRILSNLFEGFGEVIIDVIIALMPIIIVFVVFQIFILKLPKKQIVRIIKGMIITFVGLAFFLQGVNAGFMPVGELMGMKIGSLDYNWILIPIGFVLGFAVIMAEPAVHVLIDQVEQASGGHVNKMVMQYTVCIGVAVAVALAMARVLYGISLWYFIAPGYIIAFILTMNSSPDFVAIAFDAGGAATGPMTVTLILSTVVGIAKQIEGRNPLLDGFGMIALVALAPILAILILGFVYKRKEKSSDAG
mgnify:FL=1